MTARRHHARYPWTQDRPDLSWVLYVPDWYDDALCGEVGGDGFFPELGEPAAFAKRVCTACPVKPQCLEYAVSEGITDGIWGGTAPRERREIRRERQKEIAA